VAAAAWYVKNLGMKVTRKFGPPGHGHFLADAQGRMMLEFYLNNTVPVPDYPSLNAFSFHVAFQVDDVAATRERLLQAGANRRRRGHHERRRRQSWRWFVTRGDCRCSW